MLDNPHYLRDRSNMLADPFSDILKLTNAEAVVTGGFTAGGSWAIDFPGRDKVKFFAVLKGHCWILLDGEPGWIRFGTGDIGLLAVNRTFVIASEPGLAPIDAMTLFSGPPNNYAVLGDGEDFEHIGGHVLLDPVRGKLVADVLPPWIHIRADAPQAAVLRWILDRLVAERKAGLPGTSFASAQLTQLLFVEILRAHLATAELLPAGWLRALADARIAPALRLMHGDPARAWHLDELAVACAMSRTSFAQHFKTAAGVPALTYLIQWRMRLAERALREETVLVARLAHRLGYTSESAFSNAFRRVTGMSPNACRRAARRGSGKGDPAIGDAAGAQ